MVVDVTEVIADVVVEVAVEVEVVVDLAQDARRSDITMRQVNSAQIALLFICTFLFLLFILRLLETG